MSSIETSSQEPVNSPTADAKEKKVDAKEARRLARLKAEEERLREKAEAAKKYAAIFGNAEIVQSKTYNSKQYTALAALSEEMAGQVVTVRARVSTTRKTGKMAFLVLRASGNTVQAVVAVSETIPKDMVTFAGGLSPETVVDVEALVSKAEQPVTSTTKQNIELQVHRIHSISNARSLPFLLEDSSRPESQEGVHVNFDTRLNCRWLDLRSPASHAILKIQSRVCQYFRQFLLDSDFVEIHSPKLIASASEGGANVFKVTYFDRNAYLAQSPQLYKQMAVQCDYPRVFEIAPVFRAENSNTHRHLTEFVGLDLEMAINEHYYEVLDLAEGLFKYIFTNLATCTNEIQAVCAQYPFEPLVFQMTPEKVKELGVGLIDEGIETTDKYHAKVKGHSQRMLRIPYLDAVALLNTTLPQEEQLAPTDDINTTNEKKLGSIIKERYGVDFFISDRFPSAARPFYTMPCPDDERFTNSYDIFIRGEEICSGAQRIHDADLLLQRAASLKVDLTPLKDYVDSFRYGAWPHGGIGVGLERVVMLYLGLSNIRYASLFPRDPQRVTP